MRHVPEELADRIESGAATLCHAWRVERRDGEVLGFTDHDRDLTIDGLSHAAAEGWTAGAAESAIGLACGSQAAAGALSAGGLDGVGIDAGAFDGARIELWRVDWRRPDLKVRLWAGTLTRLKRQGDGFEAELDGPLAALERVAGRTYARGCDAVLGDARCGLVLAEGDGATCDGRWETCGGFGNQLNFRGFPDIPGDDFLTAHPAGEAVVDGRSRRR